MRTADDAAVCSIAGTLKVLGEKWTLLIVRECFYGSFRFEQFHQVLRCPRNLLSERLAMLVDEDVLERVEYREPGQRPRMEYRLTAKGAELMPLLLAVMHWGDRHTAGPDGPPVVARHAKCGTPLHVALVCEQGHAVDDSSQAELVEGPGAPRPAAAV